MNYFQLFIQNYFIEFIFLLYYLRDIRKSELAFSVLLANAFTHPLLSLVVLAISSQTIMKMLLLGELFVFIIETLIYRRSLNLKWSAAITASFLANLISWQFSPVVSFYFRKFY